MPKCRYCDVIRHLLERREIVQVYDYMIPSSILNLKFHRPAIDDEYKKSENSRRSVYHCGDELNTRKGQPAKYYASSSPLFIYLHYNIQFIRIKKEFVPYCTFVDIFLFLSNSFSTKRFSLCEEKTSNHMNKHDYFIQNTNVSVKSKISM